MPAGQEAPQRGLLRRLDLAPQGSQRRPTQATQDLRVAPFAFGSSRAQLAENQVTTARDLPQHRLDVSAEAFVRLGRRERPARAGEAAQERMERFVVGL